MVHHRKYTLFTFDFGIKVAQNVVQYHLHHVTYALAKFEVAMSNGLQCMRCINKKIHYLNFDLDLGVTHNVAHYPLHRVTYALQSLKLLCPTVYEMHLQENTLFYLFDLDLKVTPNVTEYPLHHVTYALVKFEGGMSNGLGGDGIIRKYNS